MMASFLNAVHPYLTEVYFFSILFGTVILIFLIVFLGRSVAKKLRKKTWSHLPTQGGSPRSKAFLEKIYNRR